MRSVDSSSQRLARWVARQIERFRRLQREPRDISEPQDIQASSSRGQVATAATVGLLTFACLFPFVDQDYLVNYQYDTSVFADHVEGFRKALSTRDLDELPRLAAWPPYFDAYDVLLTVLTAATAGLGRLSPAVLEALPTVEAQTHFRARWMSLGLHSSGMAFLWLALMRLYARPFVALSLTMLVGLAPTVIAMDLGRNDCLPNPLGRCRRRVFRFSVHASSFAEDRTPQVPPPSARGQQPLLRFFHPGSERSEC